MEWTPEIAAGFGGVFFAMIAAFTMMVKNMGKRADPAVLSIIATMQDNESKRDEAQAEHLRIQNEALTSLAASQVSQATSMEYLGQLSQGVSNAMGVMMEQFKPLPPMAASIQIIEEQSKTVVDNMDKLDMILAEILKLQAEFAEIKPTIQQVMENVGDVSVRVEKAEEQLAQIHPQVVALKKEATQEQEVAAVKTEPIEQGAKPDERTIEQLDDLAGSSGGAGDDKRHGDGSGGEASDIAPVA